MSLRLSTISHDTVRARQNFIYGQIGAYDGVDVPRDYTGCALVPNEWLAGYFEACKRIRWLATLKQDKHGRWHDRSGKCVDVEAGLEIPYPYKRKMP